MEEEIILSQKLSQLSTKSGDMEEDEDEEEAVDPSSCVTNKKRQRSTTTTPDVSSKKMKMDIDVIDHNDNGNDFNSEENQIPAFLLTTNQFFCELTTKFNDNNNDATNAININDIQDIALLLYHITDINIQKQIKLTYYQSGTGTLREPEPESILIDRRVWPTQVTSLMIAKRIKDGITVKKTAEDDHIDCVNLLREYFQEMDDKIEQYQK